MDIAVEFEMKQTIIDHVVPTERQESMSEVEFLSRSNSPVDENDGSGKNLKNDKVCGVCGDKALGNNFNAITCESCKAFFRRNALKQKDFVCPFNDKCNVTNVTRRFCQKCRLRKCFDIGMKKEWIMTDEEKNLKKRKIEQNRVKRQSSDVSYDPPPAKAPCLNDSQGLRTVTNILDRNQNSPPDPTLPQNAGKQAMMPGVDSTTFDQRFCDDELPTLPDSASNLDNSPSSSNSSSDVNVAYTAPVSGLMTPFHMSQIETAQFLNKSSSTSYNGQLPNHMMDMDGHNQLNSLSPLHWEDESSNHITRHYSMAPPMVYNNQSDRDPPRVAVVPPPVSMGHRTTHYPSQLLSQMKSGNSQLLTTNQTYQMPLLSSLIRPGESESPPDSNVTSPGGFSHIQRNNAYGITYDHQQMQPLLMDQMNPSGIRSPSSHQFNTCHSSNSYREADDDIPPPLPLNTMDSILSVAIRAEFNSFGMMNKSQETPSRELNGAEIAKLQELLMACEALGDPVDQDMDVEERIQKNSDPTLINVINLTDIAIRRLIKMSKKISAFKNMCQEDQIALLKGGCTEMMILRSVVSYDPDRDSWNIPHSYGYNIKLGVLKQARGNLYEEHQRFVKSFKPEWRSDENIMILLCAITLFTAERPNVIHKDVVKLEQDSYYYLLKRYLESIVNGCEARSTYLLLIRKIAELRILNSNHLRVFLEVNPREVEPLLREVFSMV